MQKIAATVGTMAHGHQSAHARADTQAGMSMHPREMSREAPQLYDHEPLLEHGNTIVMG